MLFGHSARVLAAAAFLLVSNAAGFAQQVFEPPVVLSDGHAVTFGCRSGMAVRGRGILRRAKPLRLARPLPLARLPERPSRQR
jgi:hypothetical protein